jgi:hypothetical protein
MMGKFLFYHINRHLSIALTPNQRLPFGGINVILAGDHN